MQGFCDFLRNTAILLIIKGNGFGLDEARKAIEIVHDIRHSQPIGLQGEYHPFAKKPLVDHPFYPKS